MLHMYKGYSAVADNNVIKVFNTEKGTREYTISLGVDTLVNGPVVTGDVLSLVVKDPSGRLKGKVYTLSRGTIKYTFSVR